MQIKSTTKHTNTPPPRVPDQIVATSSFVEALTLDFSSATLSNLNNFALGWYLSRKPSTDQNTQSPITTALIRDLPMAIVLLFSWWLEVLQILLIQRSSVYIMANATAFRVFYKPRRAGPAFVYCFERARNGSSTRNRFSFVPITAMNRITAG